MARLTDVIEGLQILAKHCYETQHLGGAEHDEIIGPMLETPLTDEETSRLKELGWRYVEEYDGWARFV